MMTSEQIGQALAVGIISEEQAAAMRAQLTTEQMGQDSAASVSATTPFYDRPGRDNAVTAAMVGEENLRFLRDFNDIFIAIGVGILGVGLYIAALKTGSAYGMILPAIVMWVLAEFFGGKKKQHLPTLLTALFFVLATAVVLWNLFAATMDPSDFFDARSLNEGAGQVGYVGLIVSGGSLIAAGMFYLRFKFPFCVYLIAASAVGLFYSLMLMISFDMVQTYFGPLIFLSGLVCFAVAVWYDQKDLTRLKRFSDNAFWLHLLAAPLVLTGAMLWKFGFRVVNLTTGDAVILLLLVAILAILGLAVNRRALLVSALIWTATGLWYIFSAIGNAGTATMMTLLVLGGGVILLGVGWGAARNFILKFLPRDGIWARVFPPEGIVLRGKTGG